MKYVGICLDYYLNWLKSDHPQDLGIKHRSPWSPNLIPGARLGCRPAKWTWPSTSIPRQRLGSTSDLIFLHIPKPESGNHPSHFSDLHGLKVTSTFRFKCHFTYSPQIFGSPDVSDPIPVKFYLSSTWRCPEMGLPQFSSILYRDFMGFPMKST